MDSGVCAALAVRDTDAAALHVSYGQRTEARERRAFEQICDRLGIRRRLSVRNDVLGRIGGSALTDESIAVPEAPGAGAEGRIGKGPGPVADGAFCHAAFFAAAVSWAETLGATRVYIGAVEQDSSGYPDCRPAYYRAFQEAVKAGTREGKIEIVTPLIAMRKAEIVKLGLELKAPLDLTWSCYSREDTACGGWGKRVLRLCGVSQGGGPEPPPFAPQPRGFEKAK